jgi:hypothetical protein
MHKAYSFYANCKRHSEAVPKAFEDMQPPTKFRILASQGRGTSWEGAVLVILCVENLALGDVKQTLRQLRGGDYMANTCVELAMESGQ